MCYPWHMPKPEGLKLPLCTYFGNECITQKIANVTYKMRSCHCLPSCSEITYKYVIDSVRKFSPDEIKSLCGGGKPHYSAVLSGEEARFNVTKMANVSKVLIYHSEEKCYDYVGKGYARVTVKMAGSSYLRRSQSIAMSFSDKLGVIGGTIGLFSGFSFVALFEFCFWFGITLFKFFKSSVEPEGEDPIEKLREEVKKEMIEIKKENDVMKEEIAKLKGTPLKKENIPAPEEPSESMVVTETE